MPKKRPLDTRIAEHENKLEQLRIEKQIQTLKNQQVGGRKRRRTR